MNYDPDIQQLPNQLIRPESYLESRIDSNDSTPSSIDYYVRINAEDVLFHYGYLASSVSDSLQEEFDLLVQRWRRDTSFHSSLSKRVTHESYQRIMAMGKNALPMILRELLERPDHWFYALTFIEGKDIAAGTKHFKDARNAWLEWGYKNNYI